MALPVLIEIEISQPLELELAVDSGMIFIPSFVPGAEPLFTASEAFKLTPSDKSRIDEMWNMTNLELLFENNLI